VGGAAMTDPNGSDPKADPTATANALLSPIFVGPSLLVGWGGTTGFVFKDKLQDKMTSVLYEFDGGLSKYMAITGTKRETSGSTWRLYDGKIDPAAAATIEAQFQAVQFAVTDWWAIRDRVLVWLTSDSMTFKEASDDDARKNSRGGWTKLTWDYVMLNVRDMTKFTIEKDPSFAFADNAVEWSYSGFWQILHELTHHAKSVPEDLPPGADPTSAGEVEKYLNPARMAFKLPRRDQYFLKDSSGRTGTGFANDAGHPTARLFWP
jgi:hypothetical protein